MRKLNYYAFIILINTIALTTTAQKNIKNQSTLEITGSALLNNERISNYSISVYFDGTRTDSIYNKSNDPVKLSLSSNQFFTLLFQKQDCPDKIVIVNTKISTDCKDFKDTTFDFKIEMSQSLNRDYSLAMLVINEKDELFEEMKSNNKFTHEEKKVIMDVK